MAFIQIGVSNSLRDWGGTAWDLRTWLSLTIRNSKCPMGGGMLGKYGIYSLMLEQASPCELCIWTCFLPHYALGWRGGLLAFILHLEAGGDLATLGATFVAKWGNTGSYVEAFVPRLCLTWGGGGAGRGFTNILCLFGGGPCSTTLIAKFFVLEGDVFKSWGGSCWVGDAMLESRAKKSSHIFEQSRFSHLAD